MVSSGKISMPGARDYEDRTSIAERLAQIRQLDGGGRSAEGSRGVLEEVLVAFRRQVPVSLASMGSALEARDYAAVGRWAHGLAGSAGALGGRALYRKCNALQTRAADGDAAGCRRLLGEVQQAADELIAHLVGIDPAPGS